MTRLLWFTAGVSVGMLALAGAVVWLADWLARWRP